MDETNTSLLPLGPLFPPSRLVFVPTEDICMLGVPLGSPSRSASFVSEKLFARLLPTVAKLVDFEDSQAAFYLLRVSFSVVRAVHFMRTTPLSHWRAEADRFDSSVRESAEAILGFPLPNPCYDQACLAPTLGGLGLRRVVDHADVAFAASRRESMKTCEEKWSLGPGSSDGPCQRLASLSIDEASLARLVGSAPDRRERQRLSRLVCDHAGAWVSAVPSSVDGLDTVMRPRVFRTAAAIRLGVPVLLSSVSCPSCMQIMDVLGDHASCCSKTSDTLIRHNRVRNLVDRTPLRVSLTRLWRKRASWVTPLGGGRGTS